jgi:hypothetical protein
MAITPVLLTITPHAWVDLYAESGVARGSKLIVQNIGTADIFLSTSALVPDLDSKAYQVIKANDFPMVNDGGTMGEWARCAADNSSLSVLELT